MQILIFGLSFGGIYTMLALAINIIYSTTRIIPFSHAAVVTFGAMLLRHIWLIMGLPLPLALILAMAATMLLNVLAYKFCVEPCGDLQMNNVWVIALFGLAHVLENSCRIMFGADFYAFPYLFNDAQITIGGVNILWHEVVMFALAIVIGIVYQYVIDKTRFGRALRAVAWKPDTALLMGIDSKRIITICFAMSGAVATVAGMLLAPVTFASPVMMANIGLKGFAAALIGGLGSTKGAIVGGFALGIIECILGIFISAEIRDALSFVIMILFIIFLPGGVMSAKVFNKGRSTAEKV